jgi:hypothetical protein
MVDNIVKLLERNWLSSPDYIRLQQNQNNWLKPIFN